MNEYIAKDCIRGLKECREKLEQSKKRMNELQRQLWNETMEISGTTGVMDLYLGMLERESERSK